MIKVINKYHKISGCGTIIYIGRGSVFGNPFPIDIGRDACVEKYENDHFKLEMHKPESPLRKAIFELVDRVASGENIMLQCFCAPKRCHGDVIKAFIERQIFIRNGALDD